MLEKHISETLRRQVRERDKYTCRLCGKEFKEGPNHRLHTHHIIPRKFGGKDEIDNLLTLCDSCHIINEFSIKRLRPKYSEVACPLCKQHNVIKHGYSPRANQKRQKYYCKSCLKFFT